MAKSKPETFDDKESVEEEPLKRQGYVKNWTIAETEEEAEADRLYLQSLMNFRPYRNRVMMTESKKEKTTSASTKPDKPPPPVFNNFWDKMYYYYSL